MYGRKKTNINRHKSFAPENARVKQKIEDAEAQETEKQQELKARALTLQRERVQESYEALGDASEEATASRRMEWMYQSANSFQDKRDGQERTVTGKVSAASSKANGAPEAEAKIEDEKGSCTAASAPIEATATKPSVNGAAAPVGLDEPPLGQKRKRTGAISEEEAAQQRKEIDDSRKRRCDPMTAMREAEQRQLAHAAKTGVKPQPKASAVGSSFDKGKALALLKQAAAVKEFNASKKQ